ncbi:MAG: hypothetical protein KDK48_02740 [Chlamydiia bacterium]|nr:hypothetical protein [Chlamydiia bacterium]
MKFTQNRALIRHLRDSFPNRLSPLYILISDDGYGQEETLKELQVLGKGYEIALLSAPKSLDEELLSQSLFARQRILFVSGAESLKLDADLLEKLLVKARGVPLFLAFQKVLSTTKFYKACEKAGVVLDLNGAIKPWEKSGQLSAWLIEQAQERNLILAPGAAKLLVDFVSDERRTLLCELEKLACYAYPENRLDEGAVRAVCKLESHETVWQLADALLARRAPAALKALHSLQESEASPIGWLRVLRKQFQTHLELASHLEASTPAAEIAEAFPSLRGQRLNTSLAAARAQGTRRLAAALVAIDKTEMETKNSQTSSEHLTEMLILKLL